MDPSGAYAFYAIPEKDKQQTVYQMKMDYPNFTLDAQKISQRTAKIFTINQDDRVIPIDRNALLVWEFADEKRTAWLYEGSSGNSQRKSSFHQIGCVLSGINDPAGQLSIKIHRVRRQL
ncbi:unnamed protein product [Onchocerca ochengi]|nr:unnamed protein product [Onchocerca ochengi]